MFNALRQLRKTNGFRQADIANMIGVSKQLYSLIERNEVRISYEQAVRIAQIFGTTPDQIFLPDLLLESKAVNE